MGKKVFLRKQSFIGHLRKNIEVVMQSFGENNRHRRDVERSRDKKRVQNKMQTNKNQANENPHQHDQSVVD